MFVSPPAPTPSDADAICMSGRLFPLLPHLLQSLRRWWKCWSLLFWRGASPAPDREGWGALPWPHSHSRHQQHGAVYVLSTTISSSQIFKSGHSWTFFSQVQTIVKARMTSPLPSFAPMRRGLRQHKQPLDAPTCQGASANSRFHLDKPKSIIPKVKH